jgi:hypothetical protein
MSAKTKAIVIKATANKAFPKVARTLSCGFEIIDTYRSDEAFGLPP